jgi:polysaccharide biosynthesis transport protein
VVAFNRDVDAEMNYWDDGSQLQTQIELLKSRALAERVIDEMGLNRRSTSRRPARRQRHRRPG